MPVYLRDSSPFYQIEFKYHGTRYRRSSETADKRLAEAMERKWRTEIVQGKVFPRVQSMTLRQAVDRYTTTVLATKQKVEAAKRERWLLAKMVRLLGAGTRLTDLTASRIAAMSDRLLADGRTAATANRYLSAIKAILRRAYREWDALREVPAIRLHRLNNQRTRWLNDDEERRLLAECVPHLNDLVIFLIDTGARLSEATRLQWDYVDLERRPRSAVRFMDTKSGRPRSVPLTTRADSLLRRLRDIRPPDQPFVFLYRPQGRGGRGPTERRSSVAVPYRNPHGAWKTACARAGFEDLHLHDLRHSAASRLVMRGVPLLTVSHILGHQSIHMTMRYSHLAPDAADSAISALEAAST